MFVYLATMFKVYYFFTLTLIIVKSEENLFFKHNSSLLQSVVSKFQDVTNSFKKEEKQNCHENAAQLINLFNLMCNNIAIEGDPTLLDACIGCFARASRSSNNQPSVSVLGECSDLYLVDTRYDDCVGIISAAQQTTNGNCVNGYCAFVRCVRRVNSDLLIARCYSEASEDNAAELEEDQIILFKNITSCILAMARCAPNNPITGQPQSNTIQTTSYNKLGIPITNNILLYNTLQVNQAGDLRTITFPETTNIQKYVCPYEFNLRQTSWLGYRC